MQRQGGGKQRGGKQGGGGNDPSCGCDMQAGWPSPSVFPRGGLQGGGSHVGPTHPTTTDQRGGSMDFTEFNLALTNKKGKTRHLKGKWNANGNNTSMNTNKNTNSMNMNTTKNTNSMNMNTTKNNSMNMNTTKNNSMNMNTTKNTNSMNTNTKNTKTKKKKTKKNTTKKTSSASNNMEKVMWKGNVYVTNKSSGDTYTNEGEYVGKYVKSADGTRTLNLDSSIPESILPPSPESQTGGSPVGPMHPTTTDQRGGAKKHDKKCTCFLCTFKNLKLAGGSSVGPMHPTTTDQRGGGGSDPVCGSCPFPGTGACPFYARGGGCGVRMEEQTTQSGGGCGCGVRVEGQSGGSKAASSQRGGGCGCGGTPLLQNGGYKATKRNLKYLKKWRKGESIGFTMTSSLKAKGLIPRSSKTMKGKRVVSRKYKH